MSKSTLSSNSSTKKTKNLKKQFNGIVDIQQQQYKDISEVVKIEYFQQKIFDIFSYFCTKHRLWIHVRIACTHNSCFGAKIRKIGIPLYTPVLLCKSGVCGGIYFTDLFS